MKRLLSILAIAGVLVLAIAFYPVITQAVSILQTQQGGTGVGSFTSGNLLYGSGINPLQSVATTSVSCSGNTTCTSFTVIGGSPITISSTGGGGAGLSTTSPISNSNVLVYSSAGAGSAYGAATTSVSSGTGISFTGTPGALIGGTNLTITNSSPLSSLSASYPFSFTGGNTLGWLGLSTSSPGIASGQPIYATGVNTIASVASSTFLTSIGGQVSGNYITALTGDVTASGPGSAAATLATVNSNVGSFTNANITVNAKGLITAASNGSGGITALGPLGQTQTGPTITQATSTSAFNGLTPNIVITGSSNILTYTSSLAGTLGVGGGGTGQTSFTNDLPVTYDGTSLVSTTTLVNSAAGNLIFTADGGALTATRNTLTLSGGSSQTSGLLLSSNTSGVFSQLSGFAGFLLTTNISRSSGTISGASLSPVISNSSTAGYTALLIQPTETTLGTGLNYLLQVGTSTATNMFNITNNGTVGIGTTTPFANLSLAGRAGETANVFAVSTSTSGFATTTTLAIDANGNLSLFNGARLTTPKLTVTGQLFDSTGSAGTSGQVLQSTGSATTWVTSSSKVITNYIATSTLDAIIQVPVVSGDVVTMNSFAYLPTCSSASNANFNIKQSTFAATTTLYGLSQPVVTGKPCEASAPYTMTATTTETWNIETVSGTGGFTLFQISATKYH